MDFSYEIVISSPNKRIEYIKENDTNVFFSSEFCAGFYSKVFLDMSKLHPNELFYIKMELSEEYSHIYYWATLQNGVVLNVKGSPKIAIDSIRDSFVYEPIPNQYNDPEWYVEHKFNVEKTTLSYSELDRVDGFNLFGFSEKEIGNLMDVMKLHYNFDNIKVS